MSDDTVGWRRRSTRMYFPCDQDTLWYFLRVNKFECFFVGFVFVGFFFVCFCCFFVFLLFFLGGYWYLVRTKLYGCEFDYYLAQECVGVAANGIICSELRHLRNWTHHNKKISSTVEILNGRPCFVCLFLFRYFVLFFVLYRGCTPE